MDLTWAYAADITKSERDDDGNLIVFGSATNPSVDLDGDRCDPEWLRSAMPEWFEWGNVREMHQPIAAGLGLELTEADGSDWQLKSKCVDAQCAKKLEEGVYKGYSIGIKNGRREMRGDQAWIVGGKIVEVSYVDRPCNPTAKLAIAKAVGVSDMDLLQPVEAEGGSETFDRAPALEIVKGLEAEMVKGPLDQGKIDELNGDGGHDDVDGAMEAVAVIARLIMSEANDLADGQIHEVYDIKCLMDALDALKWYMAAEEGQLDMRNDLTYASYAAEADEFKSAFSINQYRAKHGLEPVDGQDEPFVLKRHFTAEQRRQLAANGKAMPGGRYPIENGEDLSNAVHALGRGKGSHSAIKQHIIKRAKALGLTAQLPEGWMKTKTGTKATTADEVKSAQTTDSIDQIVKAAVAEVTKASEERIEALEAELAKVKATPIPGGPVLLAVEGVTQPDERLEKQARIDGLRARAERMSGSAADDFYALAKKLESEL